MSIEAMKQALEALENAISDDKPYILKSKEAITALRQAIEQAEKQEPVVFHVHKSAIEENDFKEHVNFYVGPAPSEDFVTLYTAPVHASDISAKRVDETEKDKHEFECPRCGHCCQQKEWVGLDNDIPSLGLVTEEFYNGMLCAEDILRKRNT
jgi:hypothetical protein